MRDVVLTIHSRRNLKNTDNIKRDSSACWFLEKKQDSHSPWTQLISCFFHKIITSQDSHTSAHHTDHRVWGEVSGQDPLGNLGEVQILVQVGWVGPGGSSFLARSQTVLMPLVCGPLLPFTTARGKQSPLVGRSPGW